MVLRSGRDQLRSWVDWSGDLELSGVDVLLVDGTEEWLSTLDVAWQLVARNSIGRGGFDNNRGWLVLADSLDSGFFGSLEKL